jgi:hypothetical protein
MDCCNRNPCCDADPKPRIVGISEPIPASRDLGRLASVATPGCCVLAGRVSGCKRNQATLAPQDGLDLVAEFAEGAHCSSSWHLGTLRQLSMQGEHTHEHHASSTIPTACLACSSPWSPSPLLLIKRATAVFCNPQPNANSHRSLHRKAVPVKLYD